MSCTNCKGTGRNPGSDYLDCAAPGCTSAADRVALGKFVESMGRGALQMDTDAVVWAIHQRARQQEREAIAAAAGNVMAWASHDGRVQPVSAMETARRVGGATAIAMEPYTIPLAPAAQAAPVVAASELSDEQIDKITQAHGTGGWQAVDDMRKFARAVLAAATPAASVAVPAELARIGELLRTQDNRYTDQPLFIVQQKRLVIGMDTDYSQGEDDIVWLIDGDQVFKGDEEFAALEAAYEETGREPENHTRTGFVVEWEFVTACFTEQGCKDYLRLDGHNLKEPRIYAEGSYRNNEYRAVRNWLMSLPAAPTQAEG